MATQWTDPPMVLMAGLIGLPVASLAVLVTLGRLVGLAAAVLALALSCLGLAHAYYNVYLPDGPAPIDKYVEFQDVRAGAKWSGKRIPITDLMELYLHGKVTFRQDILEVLRDHRDEFVNYKVSVSTLKFLVLQLFPNTANSSQKHLQATKKEIAEHYDRGNDWFESFLGPRMVYTSAVFEGLDQSLE